MADYDTFEQEFCELAKRHDIKAAWIEFRHVGDTESGAAKMMTNCGGWQPAVGILKNLIEVASTPGKFKKIGGN